MAAPYPKDSKLPEGDSTIYGFLAIDNHFFFDSPIDMPPLGDANVLSNRVIFKFDEQLYRFPIFNSVSIADEEKYYLYLLYIPRLLNLSNQWKRAAYQETVIKETPNPKVDKITGVKLENNVAYYYPQNGDLYFTSNSNLRGISNSLAVIIRRISNISGDIKYEIYNAEEIQIEQS